MAETATENVIAEDATEPLAREAVFPPGMTHIVFGQFGLQSPTAEESAPFLKRMRELFALSDGPVSVERCRQSDQDYGNDEILMAYWADLDAHSRWLRNPEVVKGWSALEENCVGDIGCWREILSPPIDRFWFFGFVMPRVGSSRFLDIKPSETFGYWGGYRDRLPAAKTDPLDSDFGLELVEPVARNTRGRRLRALVPMNILFVREGQESTDIVSKTERELWQQRIMPARDKWLGYLRDNPLLSGCISLRPTIELDLETGAEMEKHNQLAYFLTLSHLERAARSEPSHISLYNTYSDVYSQLAAEGTESKLYIWAEAHILAQSSLHAEYTNCHSKTGFLPFFDVQEVHA
jgi:heme-degrading monooxygenase HmoA